MEVQLAFINKVKYKSYSTARINEDGVVMLAVQYKASDTDNPNYSFLGGASEFSDSSNFARFKQIPHIKRAGEKSFLPSNLLMSLDELLKPATLEEFFSYHGSETRPPCLNTITWIVLTDQIDIGTNQVYHTSTYKIQ